MAKAPTESWNGLKGYKAVAAHLGVSVQTVYHYRHKCQGTLADAANMLVARQKQQQAKPPTPAKKKRTKEKLWALALGQKVNG